MAIRVGREELPELAAQPISPLGELADPMVRLRLSIACFTALKRRLDRKHDQDQPADGPHGQEADVPRTTLELRGRNLLDERTRDRTELGARAGERHLGDAHATRVRQISPWAHARAAESEA